MTQLSRLQAAMQSLGTDAVIISSPINTRYLCGLDYTDGYLLIFPSKAYLLADFRYAEAARSSVKNYEVVMPEGDMISELKLILGMNGAKSVAVEEARLSYSEYLKLSDALKGISLSPSASALLSELRSVKLEYELELIAEAQKITDAAFEHVLGFITPNVTEREVALELEFFMRRMGAESTAFDTIAVSGRSSSLPHGVPSDKKLSRGFLTMDFGAKYKGYCSDMTRTVVIGKADSDMKRIYDTVLRAQRTALELLCEGLPCRRADKAARDVITAAGFGKCFGHSLGHGVGMYIHEAPNLAPRAREDSVLRRGHVVTVEPGIYVEGKYGCRIEDMIAVDTNGRIVNFTKSPKELTEL